MSKKPRVYLSSASNDVSGSLYIVKVKMPFGKDKIILVDAGIFHNEEGDNYEVLVSPENIDLIVLTHGHTDHVGKVAKIVRDGYTGPILVSEDTAKLLPASLGNTMTILSEEAKKKGKPTFYSSEDLSLTLSQLVTRDFEQKYWLTEDISITLFRNAHLVGATCVYIQVRTPEYMQPDSEYRHEDINLFFTGDLKLKNNPLVKDTFIPKEVKEKPVHIISESTYGRVSFDKERTKQFAKNIVKAIRKNKTIIVPTLALGRTQEILHLLKKMQEADILDESVPIYLAGTLAQTYTNLYPRLKGVKIQKFLPKNFSYLTPRNSQLVYDGNTKIVLTTSGNASFGPAAIIVPYFIEQSNAVIHFTSYLPINTLGRKLYDAQDEEIIEWRGQICRKKAKIIFTDEFSSHSTAYDMVQFFKTFKNIRSILITHGDPDAREMFEKYVIDSEITKTTHILSREKSMLIDEFDAIEKNMPVKDMSKTRKKKRDK